MKEKKEKMIKVLQLTIPITIIILSICLIINTNNIIPNIIEILLGTELLLIAIMYKEVSKIISYTFLAIGIIIIICAFIPIIV